MGGRSRKLFETISSQAQTNGDQPRLDGSDPGTFCVTSTFSRATLDEILNIAAESPNGYLETRSCPWEISQGDLSMVTTPNYVLW